MYFEVIFETFDVENVLEFDLDEAVVGLYEDDVRGWRFDALIDLKPLECFVGRLMKLGVTKGFMEIIEGVDFVAIESVLLKGGGEDNTCVFGHKFGKLHSVELGHLDVEK